MYIADYSLLMNSMLQRVLALASTRVAADDDDRPAWTRGVESPIFMLMKH